MRKALLPRTARSLAPYGLTVEQWQKMLTDQGGGCIICGKGGKVKHLSVEHDGVLHRRGGPLIVGGLCCQRCNRALSAWEWSDEVMVKAINYMLKIIQNRKQYEKENKNG